MTRVLDTPYCNILTKSGREDAGYVLEHYQLSYALKEILGDTLFGIKFKLKKAIHGLKK